MSHQQLHDRIESGPDSPGRSRRVRALATLAAGVLAAAMTLSTAPTAALAEDPAPAPGPTVIADPDSPTGYTGRFVYYNATATSVRFVADIMLRNWRTGRTRGSTARSSTSPASCEAAARTTCR